MDSRHAPTAFALSSFSSLLLAFAFAFCFSTADVGATGEELNLPGLDSDVLQRAQKSADFGLTKLGDCQVCRALVKSFEVGLKATERGKYEGGDASWEERKQGSYLDSDIRFIEIQEQLCNDLTTGKDQCHTFFEKWENEIDTWWEKGRKKGDKLYDSLCIDSSKVCCPNGTFGATCTPCPGYPDSICSGRGKCKGDGTRKGSGACKCNDGYFGEMCTKCAAGYFKANEDEKTRVPECQKCHPSCLNHCRDKTPKGCEVCKDGFLWDKDYGCLDIDECVELGYNPCKRNTFCVNTEGSYECFQCDKACDGCNGDGPDNCKKCAVGFVKKDNICVNAKNEERAKQMELSRYATYFGLCVSTCIIFRKNIYVASVIGLIVALYIAVAEYTVRGGSGSNSNNFFSDLFSSEIG
ncbi:cysteine-rich with EGF-like domain protein 2 [Dinothrombium tinctorium]|uniref:Cysteine-rich with EGF-like domain protein 2 n=1 Tax=Dinothrombium tinctorium TaxID=1965070 RepID=A0A443RDG4_9ACAR|nr:cysteine-rich with EGF-like domain protein 2 [Dinothrombium tinctorium]